ncbi:hypothetical protein COY26_02890 [Candidatus Woesearchaeota archaeon CG_4_10_14_0_2_um_filter_33_10]|nr:MAG: hypothetical protein AUJ83_00375 [Candidatus Woesearchaeota archaeon CG1_02_33_12]PIN78526.1 MAG: hypothetical protein COV14_03195 [Candidatus Woesearchaeota archaeon CG10_big_fil_rev_8_21_14_0_10_33_12]PIU73085.1 MAG: hypothetical protein COS79_00225 [Candidatus Woesearchaeota archaeon CG06_land_8_20_14_3_00_33_13]PIZ53047.1 MAG: hypothetical protein COY26_02890 [Candidatus Woesearchaeota archaeon CG_4_10_14_0_2_um_filter_33_10]
MSFSNYLRELFNRLKLIASFIISILLGTFFLGYSFILSAKNYGIKAPNSFLYYPSMVLGIVFMIIGFIMIGYYRKKYPEHRKVYSGETRFPSDIHVRTTSATEERKFQESIPTLREAFERKR